MYRRSNSSSNIPLPKTNLFGCKDSKSGRRSRSVSRLSQRDSGTVGSQLRQPRNSSDRKSSTIGLLRATPLLKSGTRPHSLQRTTPNSAYSQRASSSRATTPSSERITIQKLSTDKKWVSEQYQKVQNFIMASGLFDLGTVNSNNIKPPSINNFIYITGVLLMELFPRVKISKENYKEVIPTQLKVLKYPGTLTNSVLKTVNTMYSWPQVIGMWSWLIDKVNLCLDSDDSSFINYLDPEEKTKYLLRQNVSNYLIRRYKIFNKNDIDCAYEIEKVNEAYVRNMSELLEVDYEKFKQLEADVAKNREYKSKLDQEIEHLNSENLKMEIQIEEMETEIEAFNESVPIVQKELDDELRLFQSNLNEQRELKDSINKNIAILEEAIKEQKCTYQEKLNMLRQIEELQSDVLMKREKIEHAKEIKNKFDHKLTAAISKMQSLAFQWNRSLMEVCIQKPDIKNLLLREKKFHEDNFFNELQVISDTVQGQMLNHLANIEKDLILEEQKHFEVKKEICDLTDVVQKLNKECVATANSIVEVKMQMNKVLEDLEAKKADHVQEMKELQESDTTDIQMKNIGELKQKKERLDVEVNKFKCKMLSFFVEMHEQVIGNIKQMDTIKNKIIQRLEGKLVYAVEKQREIIKNLNSSSHND